MAVHNFNSDLEYSHSQSDAPWWEEVYRQAFPNFAGMVCVRNDGWAQRGGIDRVITLTSGKTLTIDEKVRREVWPDILLERWSDEARALAVVRTFSGIDPACHRGPLHHQRAIPDGAANWRISTDICDYWVASDPTSNSTR